MVKIKTFQDLKLWQEAHIFTLSIYKLTKLFPKDELYGIVSQIRRSASSIATNIAEGMGRKSTKELLQFLNISRGSLEETKYLLLLSKDLNYMNTTVYNELIEKAELIGKLQYTLIKKLNQRTT